MNKKTTLPILIVILSTVSILVFLSYKPDIDSIFKVREAKKIIRQGNYKEAEEFIDRMRSSRWTYQEINSLNELLRGIDSVNYMVSLKSYSLALEYIQELELNENYNLVENNISKLEKDINMWVEIENRLKNTTNYAYQTDYSDSIKIVNDCLKLDINDEQKQYLESKKAAYESYAREKIYWKKYNELSEKWDENLEAKYKSMSDADFVVYTEKRYKAWDDFLNEICNEIKSFYPESAYKTIQADQLAWNIKKENHIKLAKENKAGAHINYLTINLNEYLSNITKERCSDLISNNL